MLKKYITAIILVIFLNGCVTSLGIVTTISKYELISKVESSPIIRINSTLPMIKKNNKIEIHYFDFYFINSPNRINNWEYYYKISEHTKPQWNYKNIGNIELWTTDKNDKKNIELIKIAASKNNADAIIGLYRKPINILKQNTPPIGEYSLIESRIGGYLYYGELVIKK